jgi:glycolate oxidase FAD binding subunit
MAPVDAVAIDGIVSERVSRPATPEALAEALAEASRQSWPTVIRGGGTKLGWGRRPTRVGLVLSTEGLNRVIAHRHGDLIATVEAGASVTHVNTELARQGQWLPIDAPEAATIGGTLATNAAGSLRHRFGTPRDLLIGITLVTTDGRLIKAGGQVVKNVAGYDLGKLVCGSHGTLAVIVSATFKLVPVLPFSKTLVARFADPVAAAAAIAEIGASQVEPLAFDLRASGDVGDGCEVLVRLASTQAAVEAQIRRVEQMCARGERTIVEGEADAALWRDLEAPIWSGDGAVVRLSWLPASVGPLMGFLPGLEAAEGARVWLVGRAAVGAGLMRIEGPVSAQRGVLERLRAASVIARHVVVLRAAPALKDLVDVWGPMGDTEPALQAIKQAFDPTGILNAGRGPI